MPLGQGCENVGVYRPLESHLCKSLACYAGLAGLYAEPTDLRVIHGVYPLPTNSSTALTMIFPSARSGKQKRYCLRLLQKTLKPGVFDDAIIVALQCFWTEEQDGRLQYTHEEGVVII